MAATRAPPYRSPNSASTQVLELVRRAIARGQQVLDGLARQQVRRHRRQLRQIGEHAVDGRPSRCSRTDQLALEPQPDPVADRVVPGDAREVLDRADRDMRAMHRLLGDHRRFELQQHVDGVGEIVVERWIDGI